MNTYRILVVAGREWREIYRDRMFLILAFVLPITQMLVFTYGMSLDVENVPIAILDQDHSELSREYIQRFTDSRYFDFQGYVRREADIDTLLTTGRVRTVIVVPEHFERNLLSGRPAPVQQLIDGTFPAQARTVRGYLQAISRSFEKDCLVSHLARSTGLSAQRISEQLSPIRFQVRYMYNQAVKSSESLPPRLIVLVLLVAAPFLTVAGIVREKESGSIYNLYASNTSRLEYLAGKLLPYAGIAAINALVLWAVAVWLFKAPFNGSPVLFSCATLLYVLCTTAIGLFISVFVRTQMTGILITAIITIVVGTMYSGVLTPILLMSEDNQLFSHLFPAMYYTEIVDGVFLRGVGWTVLWPDLLILAGYTALLLVISYSRFSKRPKA